MPAVSQGEAIHFLHDLVSTASDEDILDGWDMNLRAAVYRSWFHGAINQLDGRISQSNLDLWQRALKAQPRMRLATESSSTSSSSSASTSLNKKSNANHKKNRHRSASSPSASSSRTRNGKISYNAPTKPAPVVIPSSGTGRGSGGLAKIKKRRTEREFGKKHTVAPIKGTRSRSPDRKFDQLNVRLGELKSFIDEQFQSLRQTEMHYAITPPPKRKVQVGNSSGGDSPPETSPSPSASPSPSSRSRRKKMRRRPSRGTPVAALDMIQETADSAVEKEEDIVATVMESPECEQTPPAVSARTYLLVSPKGASAAASSLFARVHAVSPASNLPKSPIYDSRWEPKMSDTRVNVGLIPLSEACVATPSPDIFVGDDDPDELENILAKYL